MSKDYYKLLGIEKNANSDEIKRAYRKLAMQYHPDKGGGKEAEEKFKQINEAYQILSDPQKRSQYDRFGSSAFNGGQGYSNQGSGGFDFSGFQNGGFKSGGIEFDFGGFGGLGDIFEDFFGQAFATINTELEISPAQAVLGDDFSIKVGNETVELKIPAGVQNGTTFQIKGKGRQLQNGRKGDLNITLKIKMPRNISQEQKDLWQKLKESESKKKSWWGK
jgi:DnaJ-class molecular chaperone